MKKRGMRRIAILLLCVFCFAAFFGCSPHVHTYSSGNCTSCGEACPHRYNGGVCIICGGECDHEYINSVCTVCGEACPHDYTDGVCVDCGKACDHTYVIGVCTVCGEECEHEAYIRGVCAECGTACAHDDYISGVCTVCGIQCSHSYNNGVCIVCGYACLHNYAAGVCADCGRVCPHAEYKSGACIECGTVCTHEEYANGTCIECGTVCTHEVYANGVCAECGTACEHDYYNRVCVICGSVKPAHYDYAASYADKLPRISIVTDDAGGRSALMSTADMGFNGQPGSKDNRPYYGCRISVDNCAESYVLTDVAAQVKIRGNYTANYPKKPFRIKFEKKQAMLGLNGGRKFKSWVLLADYKDIAMTRNALTFYLSKQILGSDDYYSSDFLPVELYLNDTYWGMYLLAEQQQVNSGRVDITEPADGYQGADIGYLLEYDGYYMLENPAERFSCDYYGYKQLTVYNGSKVTPQRNIGFAVKNDVYYADENDCAQTRFISKYIADLYKLCYEAVYNRRYYAFNGMCTELVAYTPTSAQPVRETIERVLDVRSLVDVYIINEIACDADISWSSFYMSVDFGAGGDRLLRFQAPWDFDSALGLKDACASGNGMFAANSNNPWLALFINEQWFRDEIRTKWKEAKAAGAFDGARALIRMGREKYADAYKRNFDKWGFVKSGELNSTAMGLKDHAAAVEHLYGWFDTRIKYLDGIYGR